MKSIRRIHGWLGVLFAPSIILFALSGMFQISGCHEADEEGHPPNSVIVRMSQIHMHQTAELPKRRARPPQAAAPQPEPQHAAEPEHEEPFNPLKWFFIALCLALTTSSVLGVWIALTSKRDQKLHIGLLAAGIVLPIVMLIV